MLRSDHYLEVLTRKPGAFPGATALAQAKATGAFTLAHQRYWDANRRAHGDAAGTRALVEVLLAHRSLPAGALVTAADRRHQCAAQSRGGHHPGPPPTSPAAVPVSIGTELARYDRPTPSLAGYDELLTPTTRSAP